MTSLVLKFPWFTALLLSMCVGTFLFAPNGSEWFSRLALDQSHPQNALSWASAHFIHSDGNHVGWNLVALAILGYLIERQQRALLAVALMVGMIAVTTWFFVQTQFDVYVGFSGALNSLLVAALYVLRQRGSWWRGNEILWLVFWLAVIKSVYEYHQGIALFSATQWQTTPSFHLVGMVAGVGTVGLWHAFRPGR